MSILLNEVGKKLTKTKKKYVSLARKIIIKTASLTPVTRQVCVDALQNRRNRKFKSRFYDKYEVQDNIIMFESFMGRQYSCSPKALYEAMMEDSRYDGFIKVWAFKNPAAHLELNENPNTRIVKYRGWKYCRYHAQAKYCVTNSRVPNEIVLKPEQKFIQCWHGTPLKRLGFDIENYTGSQSSTDDLRHNYTIDAMRYTDMPSPSPFYTEKITSAFNLKALGKENIFMECGYPRNDFLYSYTQEQKEEIRKTLGVPEGKKIVLYAPTWRENQHEAGVGYTYDLGVDFDVLQRELGDDFVILFRAHYFISNAFDFEKYEGFIVNVSNYNDINHLYVAADMLITDYSSVFFDYANLDRPIIFYMYDFEEYKNNMRDFYLDIEELPGPIVKEEADLIAAIRHMATDFVYDEKFRIFNDKFNPHREPCAAKFLEQVVEIPPLKWPESFQGENDDDDISSKDYEDS